MTEARKKRVWIGIGQLFFALLLFGVILFAVGIELVRSWTPSNGEAPNYGGMVIGVLYVIVSMGGLYAILFLSITAFRWLLGRGVKQVHFAIVLKSVIGIALLFWGLVVSWVVGKLVYLGVGALYLGAGITELVFAEKLRGLEIVKEKRKRGELYDERKESEDLGKR